MKPKSTLRPILAALGAAVIALSSASAADLFWSGTGDWDTSNQVWGTTSGGPYTAAIWNNSNNDTAIFEGTEGTVTLEESITVGGLTFDIAGYTVTGNTLAFGLAGNIEANADAAIESILSGSSAITKTGIGTLTLTGASDFSGATTISSGTLLLNGVDGALTATSGITLLNTGTLTLDNTASANNTDRIGNSIGITSNGGTINFANDGSDNAFSETLGTLTLTRGALTLNTSEAGASGTSALTLADISRSANGGTILFSGTGFGVDTRNQVLVSSDLSTANVGGIIPWALIKDGSTYDLAAGGGAGGAVTQFTSYDTDSGNPTWGASVNARPNNNVQFNGTKELNSLVLDNGINLNAPTSGSSTITIGSATQAGLIVQTGGDSIIGRTATRQYILAFGDREAIFHTVGNLNVQRGNAPTLTGTGGLTKTGEGTLILGQESNRFEHSLTGTMNLNQGLVEALGSATALRGSASDAINFNGGNLTLRNNNNNNFAMTYSNPLTVNADTTITIDRQSNATAAAWTATFGTLALNNNPNITINSGEFITSGVGAVQVGVVTSSTGLTKSGNGRLILTGTNTYSGPTILDGGFLRYSTGPTGTWEGSGTFSPNTNLEIRDGIVEVWFPGTRALGTGNGEIQITGGRSGFTLLQGDRSTNLFWDFGNVANVVTWGTPTFNPDIFVVSGEGAAATLRLDNPFDLNGANRTIEVAASGNNNSGGTYGFMNGTISGTGASLTKTGVGTLVLNGTNTYNGGTTIDQGGLWFYRTVAMPASGEVTVNDGGILSVGIGNTGGWTTGTSGNGTIGGLLAELGGQSGSTVSYDGNVFLGFNVTGTQEYSGDIGNVSGSTSLGIHVGNKDRGFGTSGGGADSFIATGTLTLSGNNTYTGGTTVNAGTLRLVTPAAASTSTALNLTTGTALELRSDTSTTFFSGAPVDIFTPGTTGVTIDVGNNGSGTDNTLTLGSALNRRQAGASVTTLTVTGADGYSLAIPAVNLTGGNSLTLNPTTAAGINITTLTATTGATSFGSAGNITLALGGNAGTNNSITTINETSNAGQQLIINKNTAATWTLGNVDVKQGNNHAVSAGIINLNGTFEWTSTNWDRRFTVSGGQLNYNNAGALRTLNGRLQMTGGSMDNTSGAAITTSTYNPGLELAGNWTFIGSNGADSDLNFGTGAVRIVGTTGTNRTITVQNASTKLTLGGAISSNAAWNSGSAPGAVADNGLIKAGDGTLELTNANTYTGPTVVSEGTLELSSSNQTSGITLGADGVLGLTIGSPATAPNAAVDLSVGKVKVTGTTGAPSYTLLTASSITPLNPALAVPISGYQLEVFNGNELRLVQTGGLSPYELWATNGELFDEDANGDGVANGLAFLLGAANPNVSALDLLPIVTETGGSLVLTFDMLKPINRGTATLSVEHSRDVGIDDDWTTVLVTDTNSGPTNGVTFVVGTGAGTTNPVTATISASEAGGTGKLFGRLKGQE